MSHSILNSSTFPERLHAGDDEAYVILYREGLAILKPCFMNMGLINDAEDLLSETVIKLRRTRCASFNPSKGSFEGWFYCVGRNLAIDVIRKREGEVPLDDYRDHVKVGNSTEEEESGSRFLKVLVKRAEASLGPNDRAILSLRIVEGLSFNAISCELGISVSAAAMRVSRALERLHIEMERLSTCELPRRIRRCKRRNFGRVVSASCQKQRKSSGSK